jgi:hypothetical protein
LEKVVIAQAWKAGGMTRDTDGGKGERSKTSGASDQKSSQARAKPKPGKEERLAEALRANLRRRKASAKTRKNAAGEDG